MILAPVLCAADADVAAGLNRFSASLYSRLASTPGSNLIVSPYSISTALSMVLAGARGGTSAEIAKVLGQSNGPASYHSDLAALVERIGKAANTGDNLFLPANRVWIQRDFDILPEYRRTLDETYHAPAAAADFVHNAEVVRREINSWTEQQTKSRIRDLFAPGALGPDTRLVLTSAVYFYGKWEHAFRKSDTQPAPFTLGSGSTVQTDFMNQTGRFGYVEGPDGQFLEMRYAGTGIAFDILLPKKGAALDAPSSDRLAAWIGALQERKVNVSVPKFRVESQFSLADTLASLGMPSAFSASADFSGIDGRRDLQLTRVVHKAFVDVAEEGTEAAAATGIGVALVAMAHDPTPVFRADHPFFFLIHDTRSGLPLFSGRLVNPKQ
jgi:serpin B